MGQSKEKTLKDNEKHVRVHVFTFVWMCMAVYTHVGVCMCKSMHVWVSPSGRRTSLWTQAGTWQGVDSRPAGPCGEGRPGPGRPSAGLDLQHTSSSAGKQGINAALADKLSVTTNQSSNHSITKSLPYDALYQFLRAVLYVCFL